MAERPSPHADLAGYVLGRYGPDGRTRFEEHLATCPSCRESLPEMSRQAARFYHAVPAFELPPGLEARTLIAVERAAAEARAPGPAASEGAGAPEAIARPGAPSVGRRRLWPRRLGLALATAAAIAAAFFVGARLEDDELPGTLELDAVLTAPGNPARTGTVEVRETGTGRVVSFRTNDLAILPTGELYELWFVGPGDSRRDPNRISAGTFHPDEQGRSRVRFHAAVDPSKYQVLSVTAEPGDGDPERSGPEVLRARPRR